MVPTNLFLIKIESDIEKKIFLTFVDLGHSDNQLFNA